MLCPRIILKGKRLTLKTELAFELNQHPLIVGPRRYRYHSPIISAEWCVFTNHPWERGLINFAPEEEALALDTYRTWARLFTQVRYFSWIIDRFHLSTRAYPRQHARREVGFASLEDILLPLGFRVALLTRSPESFAQARTDRLRVSGNPQQYDDLGTFLREQELFRELVAQSRLPSRQFDVSGHDVPRVAEETAGGLEQTGGLYVEDG